MTSTHKRKKNWQREIEKKVLQIETAILKTMVLGFFYTSYRRKNVLQIPVNPEVESYKCSKFNSYKASKYSDFLTYLKRVVSLFLHFKALLKNLEFYINETRECQQRIKFSPIPACLCSLGLACRRKLKAQYLDLSLIHI